jgi:hypothetical protein
MILTLIIKRGIGIRILKHDSDFELKNAPRITPENGQKNKQRSTKHLTKENMLYDTINTIK